MSTFYTIGHSTRSTAEFIQILESAQIETVVDVRTVPRSRTNPQFNTEALRASLREAGIGYVHLPELGGLRSRPKGGEPSPNDFWDNQSFRNYADYARTEPFRSGLAKLVELGAESRSAIMCAEAVWWRCHRRIIADYLMTAGADVVHLMGPGKAEPAKITPAAQQVAPGMLVYRK
jgi:uncharacterized protein (DUF488 family)